MRPQPLLAVVDVEASSRWYQRLLGCRSDHGGTEYERLVDGDRLVLQLHSLEIDHDHGRIGDPTHVRGNGVLLWFEVDDFDAAVARSGELDAEVVLPVHRNPNVREPALATLSGLAAGGTIGGITGALVGTGIPEYEAQQYEGKLREGNVLISVHADDSGEAARVREIMIEEKADNISTGTEASVPKPHLPNEAVARREPSTKL